MSEAIGRVVIVGASLGGASAAAALRERGFDGTVVLAGSENVRPYERPSLSKAFLMGDEDTPTFVHDEGYYTEHDIDLRLGATVTSVDRMARTVTLADGATEGYDRLVLATGAEPRRLPVPGGDLDGIHLLRTVSDAETLKALTGRVAIVGAGWIGSEVAASLRRRGLDVVLIDPLEAPLLRVVGPEVGGHFATLHREQGVDLRLGVGVSEILGTGRAEGVRLADGTDVPADAVIVGIGVAPRLDLAKEAGLELTGGGVRTNARLQTSDPSIFAIGDIAAAYHPRYGTEVRVEHWATAKDHGAFVAGAILGDEAEFDSPPFFFSDQYDLGMEYRGWADPGHQSQVVVRGDAPNGGWFAFWLQHGRVQAVLNANEWDDGDHIDAIVRARPQIAADRLRGESLADLAANL